VKAAPLNEGVFHIRSSSPHPRVLIVENDFSVVEPLLHTFRDKRLDFDFDACTSSQGAVRKLLASPYRLIISGAHLAEMDDFSLVKRAQTLEISAPVVVTASASTKETARRALAEGAFDLISVPLDHEQTVRTIRLALWQSKLLELIARKEKAVDLYRRHLAEFPNAIEQMEESFNRAFAAIDLSIYSIESSIRRVEESSVCFADFATKVEFHARKGALERLDALPS
jgi:DNA-binding NtrC family response regulator